MGRGPANRFAGLRAEAGFLLVGEQGRTDRQAGTGGYNCNLIAPLYMAVPELMGQLKKSVPWFGLLLPDFPGNWDEQWK